MFKFYITFFFIFLNSQLVYTSHPNAKDGTSSNKYFILDPIKYNNFVRNLVKNQVETASGSNLRSFDNQGSLTAGLLQDIICKEADLVFSSTESNTGHNTVLNLNIGDARIDVNSDYLLLFGADRCILESSPDTRKSVKIRVRIINDLINTQGKIYYDKICDCLFKKGNVDENVQNEFEVQCNSDPLLNTGKEQENYLEIGGAENFNGVDLVKLPNLITQNSQVDKPVVKVTDSKRAPVKHSRTSLSRVKAKEQKSNNSNFSKYFWQAESGFFGEGQEAVRKANVEYCKSFDQSESCENKQKSTLEKEFRENCNNKEHQLILETLLIIVNKLIEHLDNK